MQINRLFQIVYLLMNQKIMTAQELAAHFEVSTRTILRDIDTLSMAGVPVYTTQGKGGGISLQEQYVLNKAVIPENEQNQILFALQGLAAAPHMDTDSVQSRLRSLFRRREKDWIEVDFSRWGNGAADKAKFETLRNALLNGQAITFTYSNTYGETAGRRVYPIKLLFKSKSWYLQAFCLTKNDYRTFKINRMRQVEIQPETFDSQAYSLPEPDKTQYPPTNPESGPPLIHLKLRFTAQAAYRVYDEYDDRDIEKKEDGSHVVSITLPHDNWIYDYILSFGTTAEVLEPLSVRAEMARLAEKIKNKYAP